MKLAPATAQNSTIFGRLFSNYVEAQVEVFRRQAYTRTVRKMEDLDDRQLADIGVPRDQIRQRAHESVYLNMPHHR